MVWAVQRGAKVDLLGIAEAQAVRDMNRLLFSALGSRTDTGGGYRVYFQRRTALVGRRQLTTDDPMRIGYG